MRTSFLLGPGIICLAGSVAFAQALRLEAPGAEIVSGPHTGGEPEVSVRLTDASRVAFARFSTDHVGRKIELRVDGRIISAPVLRTSIVGGVVMLGDRLTREQARDLAMRIASGAQIEVESSR